MVSRTTVNRKLPEKPKVGQVPSKQEEMEMAARLYQTTTLPVDTIAAQFGVSRQTIHSWLKDLGIPQRGAMGARKKPGVDGTVSTTSASLALMQAEHEELRRGQERVLVEMGTLSDTLSRIEGALTALVALLSAKR